MEKQKKETRRNRGKQKKLKQTNENTLISSEMYKILHLQNKSKML